MSTSVNYNKQSLCQYAYLCVHHANHSSSSLSGFFCPCTILAWLFLCLFFFDSILDCLCDGASYCFFCPHDCLSSRVRAACLSCLYLRLRLLCDWPSYDFYISLPTYLLICLYIYLIDLFCNLSTCLLFIYPCISPVSTSLCGWLSDRPYVSPTNCSGAVCMFMSRCRPPPHTLASCLSQPASLPLSRRQGER